MDEISLEKVHSLLEKLAEYVMNQLPTNRKVDARFENMETRLNKIEEEKADKKDVEKIKQGINSLLNGMDAQAKQLDIIRTEQVAFNSVFNRLEKRVTNLEEKQTGYRIRDAEE